MSSELVTDLTRILEPHAKRLEHVHGQMVDSDEPFDLTPFATALAHSQDEHDENLCAMWIAGIVDSIALTERYYAFLEGRAGRIDEQSSRPPDEERRRRHAGHLIGMLRKPKIDDGIQRDLMRTVLAINTRQGYLSTLLTLIMAIREEATRISSHAVDPAVDLSRSHIAFMRLFPPLTAFVEHPLYEETWKSLPNLYELDRLSHIVRDLPVHRPQDDRKMRAQVQRAAQIITAAIDRRWIPLIQETVQTGSHQAIVLKTTKGTIPSQGVEGQKTAHDLLGDPASAWRTRPPLHAEEPPPLPAEFDAADESPSTPPPDTSDDMDEIDVELPPDEGIEIEIEIDLGEGMEETAPPQSTVTEASPPAHPAEMLRAFLNAIGKPIDENAANELALQGLRTALMIDDPSRHLEMTALMSRAALGVYLRRNPSRTAAQERALKALKNNLASIQMHLQFEQFERPSQRASNRRSFSTLFVGTNADRNGFAQAHTFVDQHLTDRFPDAFALTPDLQGRSLNRIATATLDFFEYGLGLAIGENGELNDENIAAVHETLHALDGPALPDNDLQEVTATWDMALGVIDALAIPAPIAPTTTGML